MQIRNVRFIVAAIITFCAFSVYVSRVNLSIAIIAMVEDHHGDRQAAASEVEATRSSEKEPQPQIAAASNSSDNNHPLPLVGHENNASGSIPANGSPPSTEPLVDRAFLHTPDASADPAGSMASANATSGEPMQQRQLREPLLTAFPTSTKSLQVPSAWQDKFPWSTIEQGHILGAFFYGYILIQIPGARLAESVGAKWIITAASVGSAVISLAFPLATQLNSIYLLMALRFAMGLCQSAFFPAGYVLYCRWFPESERSILLPIMFIGGNLGSISTYALSSHLISSAYGWPAVFYLSGGICSVCSLLWLLVGSSEPSDNWLISDKERCFIVSNVDNLSGESASCNGDVERQAAAALKECRRPQVRPPPVDCNNNNTSEQGGPEQKLLRAQGEVVTAPTAAETKTSEKQRPLPPTPSWSKLVTSIPVWTLILSMYGNEWSHVVICYELPTYLNTALNFPIEQNGVINSVFQLTYALASPLMSSLGAYLLDIHWLGMRKIHVRKLFQSLATFGQLICYISIPVCGANRGLIIMFMFLTIICKACSNAGDVMVPGDLSPEYAGTIFACANSFGNTAGFFVPLLTGVFVTNHYVREQWAPFWYTTAAIMGCSGLIFITFGETRRQDLSLDGSGSADGGAGNCLEMKEADEHKKLMKLEVNGQKTPGAVTSGDSKQRGCMQK